MKKKCTPKSKGMPMKSGKGGMKMPKGKKRPY